MIYLVLINMQLSQVRIEEQLIGHHINGRLASSFVAHVPLRIDEAPEARTCKIKHRRQGSECGWSDV